MLSASMRTFVSAPLCKMVKNLVAQVLLYISFTVLGIVLASSDGLIRD
jgi:hypothetical protein